MQPFLKFIACQANLFMHHTYLGAGHKITDIVLLPISFVVEALHSW